MNRSRKVRKIFFLFFTHLIMGTGHSQNQFPANDNVIIDGESIVFLMPSTTGGWARGNWFANSSDTETWGGIGIYGSGTSPHSLYMAHGASPWSSGKGLYVRYTGKVGIGTNNPSDLLHLTSDSSTTFRLHTESTTDNSIIIFTGKRGSGANSSHNLGTTGTDNKDFVIDVDESLLIKNNRSISMIVDGDGDVGIGTSIVPSGYKLAVDGHIRAREIRVDHDTWPDYVFGKEYRLPTLGDVERYIDEKGHLPDIPSAQEIHEKGFELAKMNGLLLKKIEELVLYTIQQQRELENQKAKNQLLEERIKTLERQSPKNKTER